MLSLVSDFEMPPTSKSAKASRSKTVQALAAKDEDMDDFTNVPELHAPAKSEPKTKSPGKKRKQAEPPAAASDNSERKEGHNDPAPNDGKRAKRAKAGKHTDSSDELMGDNADALMQAAAGEAGEEIKAASQDNADQAAEEDGDYDPDLDRTGLGQVNVVFAALTGYTHHALFFCCF